MVKDWEVLLAHRRLVGMSVEKGQEKIIQTYTRITQAQRYLGLSVFRKGRKIRTPNIPGPRHHQGAMGSSQHDLDPMRRSGLTRWCMAADDMSHEKAERRVERTVIPAKVLKDEIEP